MEVTSCKVLVLFLLAAIKLLAGLAPLYITNRLRKVNSRMLDKVIGVVLCLGGGVLLSTVFVHILPEVRESMERAAQLGVHMNHYPFAEVLICSGFLLIFLVEALVQKCCGHGHGHGFVKHPPKPGVVELDMREDEEGAKKSDEGSNGSNNNKIRARSDCKPVCSTPKPVQGLKTQLSKLQEVCNESAASFNDSSASIMSSMQPAKLKEMISNMAREKRILSSVRSCLVVVALSVHSVFEGMALGLQETEAGVWKLFLAVAIHATAILFCIGMEMVASGTRKVEMVTYMIILSLVTPVGIVIGIMVTESVEEASGVHVLVMGVLQGLAGGTLLYITFFEVLDRDKLNKYGMNGMIGVVAVVFGFVLMASMEGFGGHSHGGGGHHGHDHDGGEEHDHDGGEEHDHDGGEEHEHDHDGGEVHEHDGGEEHEHDHDHDGGEEHEHDHDHDHDGGEEHEHDHDHNGGEEHEHDHDHNGGEEHEHDHEGGEENEHSHGGSNRHDDHDADVDHGDDDKFEIGDENHDDYDHDVNMHHGHNNEESGHPFISEKTHRHHKKYHKDINESDDQHRHINERINDYLHDHDNGTNLDSKVLSVLSNKTGN